MDKEKEEKDIDELTGEDSEEQDPDKEIDEESADENDQEISQEKGVRRRLASSIGHHKGLLLSALSFILITTVLVLKFVPGLLLDRQGEKATVMSSTKIDEDNLSEEMLLPFFIPHHIGLSKGAARIDLSVIWDGLASVRFKKKELQIRDNLYGYIVDFSKKNGDLSIKTSLMENEMSEMLRKFLGGGNLVVKIKEINYF